MIIVLDKLILASYNNPAASCSAVANVIATIGFPLVPAVVMVSGACAGIPAAVIIPTALDVPGVSDAA